MGASPGDTVVFFILIDALGWNILQAHPFLESIAPHRCRNRTVLGFSSAAIPTILTGKLPSEHGRWNLLSLAQGRSPFFWVKPFRGLPRSFVENRGARKVVNTVSKIISRSEGYFSSYGVPFCHLHRFDVCEKKNIYKPGGIPGCETIIDYMRDAGVSYRVYSYHDGTDEELLDRMGHDVASNDAYVYFQYLSGMDAFLHQKCGMTSEVANKMDWYADKISNIYRAAIENGKSVRLFLFSDHGMTPIVMHYDLISDLTTHGIDLERDCMAAFDSTMARFWVTQMGVESRIRLALERCTAGRWLPEEELRELGVHFPDHRYGDMIFLMHPGTLIFPNWFGRYAPAGMHGFHPDDSHSDAAFISNVEQYSPKSICDFFSIMKHEIDALKMYM